METTNIKTKPILYASYCDGKAPALQVCDAHLKDINSDNGFNEAVAAIVHKFMKIETGSDFRMHLADKNHVRITVLDKDGKAQNEIKLARDAKGEWADEKGAKIDPSTTKHTALIYDTVMKRATNCKLHASGSAKTETTSSNLNNLPEPAPLRIMDTPKEKPVTIEKKGDPLEPTSSPRPQQLDPSHQQPLALPPQPEKKKPEDSMPLLLPPAHQKSENNDVEVISLPIPKEKKKQDSLLPILTSLSTQNTITDEMMKEMLTATPSTSAFAASIETKQTSSHFAISLDDIDDFPRPIKKKSPFDPRGALTNEEIYVINQDAHMLVSED